MRSYRGWLVMVLSVLGVAAACCFPPAAAALGAAVPDVQVLSLRTADLWSAPEVSGSRVVWLQSSSDGSNFPGLVGTDFLSGADFFIRQIEWGDAPPHFAFGDTTVVYFYPASANEIWGYDVVRGVNFPVKGGYKSPRTRFAPQVSGNVVVWESAEYTGPETMGKFDIGGYNLKKRKRLTICTAAGDQSNPSISGDVVVWYDKRAGQKRLFARRLSGGGEFALCKVQTKWWVAPIVSGSTVAFSDRRNGSWNIYGYDLKKRATFPICTAAGNQTNPDISGNLVAWCDSRGGGSLRARLLPDGPEFTLASYSTSGPSISGTTVVWSDGVSAGATIYRAQLTW